MDDGSGDTLTRLRLDIAYDGAGFSGWAVQPSLRTVQGVLEQTLATLFPRSPTVPRLVVAGRTDAGVHATGQVAHVDLSAAQLAALGVHRGVATSADAPSTLLRRMNGIAGLDSDVWVTGVSFAPTGFDARFSAIWRRYQYRISDGTGPRNPLERGHTLWYPAELDLDSMNSAALSLLGLHDWAAYCKPRAGATTIRTLQDYRWRRDDDGVLVAVVQADAFCHSMVRALVGATIAVGEGKLNLDALRIIRDRLVRSNDFTVAPAKGLTLLEVGYPADAELEARAKQTRAVRPPLGTEA
ncbi:tRNA pseudouridine(38-40) synthase TruA [soil metagenome]